MPNRCCELCVWQAQQRTHQGKLRTEASGLAGAGASGATLDMSSSTAGLTCKS